VVITGGSGYLGSEWGRFFTEQGANVVIWDIKHHIDVTSLTDVASVTAATIEKFKKIDVLICGAALNAPFNHPYERYPEQSFIAELHVNLVGTQNTIQVVASRMMECDSGSIILISSELGLIGPNNWLYSGSNPKDIAYITSKHGVIGLMRAWACYLGTHNIRVNALCPGGITKDQSNEFALGYSELNLLKRMGNRDEMNGPLLFLASDASSFMTGATLVVDGGRTAW